MNEPGLERKVDIYFEEKIVDWYKKANEGRYKYKRHEAVQCTQEHFGTSKDAVDYFKSWEGFSLVCLNLNSYKDFSL